MVSPRLKIALRTLYRNKAYVLINVLGLGVALSCCMIAYINYVDYADFDAIYADKNRVFRVNSFREAEGERQKWGVTPLALGPAAIETVPGIERFARLQQGGVTIRQDGRLSGEGVLFADPAVLDILDFPVLSGSPAAFDGPTKIMLSDRTAERYFADENPIGQTLEIANFRDGEAGAVTVVAVLKELPRNSSFQFQIIMHYDDYLYFNGWENSDWSPWQQPVTLFELGQNVEPETVESGLQQFVVPQNQARPNWMVASYFLQPLPEIAHHSGEFIETALNSPRPFEGILIMIGLAGLILLIACFNFTNTTVALSGSRLREIGYKKVIGARRSELIRQFVGESLLLCIPAVVIGMGLAYFLGVQLVNQGMSIEPRLDILFDVRTWGFLVGIVLLTGLLAGLYPALYISSFQPVQILSGRSKFRGANMLTRILLGAQLAASILAIVVGVVFTQNARYQEKLPLGFNTDEIILMPAFNPNVYQVFGEAARSIPGVKSVAGTGQNAGLFSYRALFSEDAVDADDHEVFIINPGPGYIETMDMEVVAGRSFDGSRPMDAEAAMINETLTAEMGWTPSSAIGKAVICDGRPYTVIGVVKDFKQFGMRQPVPSMAMNMATPDQMGSLAIRANKEDLPAVRDQLEAEWYKHFPDLPFYSGFMENMVLYADREANERMTQSFLFLAIIATALSAVGLFSLVSLRITARTKEIGVRKVLGASVGSLVGLISNEVTLVLLSAVVVGSVAGLYVCSRMLDAMFAFRVGVGATAPLIAALTLLLTTTITIGYQVYRAANANPVDSIRTE